MKKYHKYNIFANFGDIKVELDVSTLMHANYLVAFDYSMKCGYGTGTSKRHLCTEQRKSLKVYLHVSII